MYDGINYKSTSYPSKSNSSSGGRLQPYQKTEVWEKNIKSIKEGCSPKGQKVWDEFLENMKKRRLGSRKIQWIRKKN